MIAAPPTGDNLPIAVVIHGSHGSGCASTDGVTEAWPCPESEKRHFEGFAYLLEALARQGYVAIAINANPVYAMAYGETDTPRRMPVLFDLYMAQLAAAGRGETVDFGVDLKGRLDLSRLALLGHSQGGAGRELHHEEPRRTGHPGADQRRPGSYRGRNPAGAVRQRRSGRAVDRAHRHHPAGLRPRHRRPGWAGLLTNANG